jgi:hypothetical protein
MESCKKNYNKERGTRTGGPRGIPWEETFNLHPPTLDTGCPAGLRKVSEGMGTAGNGSTTNRNTDLTSDSKPLLILGAYYVPSIRL